MPKNIFWPLLMYNSVITKTIWLHRGYFYILIFLHDSEPGRKRGHGSICRTALIVYSIADVSGFVAVDVQCHNLIQL